MYASAQTTQRTRWLTIDDGKQYGEDDPQHDPAHQGSMSTEKP
jgi:hypothetical protein